MFHGREPILVAVVRPCPLGGRVRKVGRRNLCNVWDWLFHRFALNLALFLSLLLRNASFGARQVALLVTCLSCTTHLVHAVWERPCLKRIIGGI